MANVATFSLELLPPSSGTSLFSSITDSWGLPHPNLHMQVEGAL